MSSQNKIKCKSKQSESEKFSGGVGEELLMEHRAIVRNTSSDTQQTSARDTKSNDSDFTECKES